MSSSMRPMSWPARFTTLSWISVDAPRVLRNLCMTASWCWSQMQQAAFHAPHGGRPSAAQPARGDQPALAVAGERDVRRIELFAIPQLAGHLLVLLIERLAVVGELAAPDLVAAALAQLAEPVGVGKALARGRDDVGLAALENLLGLGELADAAGGDHRGLEPSAADRRADRPRQADV